MFLASEDLLSLDPNAVIIAAACAVFLVVVVRAIHVFRTTGPTCQLELATPHGAFLSRPLHAPLRPPAYGSLLHLVVDCPAPVELDATVTGHRADGRSLIVTVDAPGEWLSEDHAASLLARPWPRVDPFGAAA